MDDGRRLVGRWRGRRERLATKVLLILSLWCAADGSRAGRRLGGDGEDLVVDGLSRRSLDVGDALAVGRERRATVEVRRCWSACSASPFVAVDAIVAISAESKEPFWKISVVLSGDQSFGPSGSRLR